jgi:hypothetical protein
MLRHASPMNSTRFAAPTMKGAGSKIVLVEAGLLET